MKDSEVEGKFFNLAAPKITKAGADRLVEQCWKLDEAANVSKLMASVEIKN